MWIQIREDPELLGQIRSGSVILFLDLDLVPDLTFVDKRICITFALPVKNIVFATWITH
jgi:hypothetical protein